MPTDELTYLREMGSGRGSRHGRADFVEMKVPDQLETGCAENVRILQQLQIGRAHV